MYFQSVSAEALRTWLAEGQRPSHGATVLLSSQAGGVYHEQKGVNRNKEETLKEASDICPRPLALLIVLACRFPRDPVFCGYPFIHRHRGNVILLPECRPACAVIFHVMLPA